MCFSSGGSQTTTQKFEPPDFTKAGWEQYLGNIGNLTANMQENPGSYIYGANGQQLVAPLNQTQQNAGGGIASLATDPYYLNSAFKGALGNILSGSAQNPFGNSQNQFIGQANPFMGDNPYLQSAINKGQNDITTSYKTGTAAQNDAAAATSGAFGGSAYNEKTAQNEKTLGDALSNYENQMRYQNYQNSGNLWQQGQAQNIAAQQAQNALNAGTWSQGQQQAISAAALMPAYNQQELGNLQALLGYGTQQQGQSQAEIEAKKALFNQIANYGLTINDILGNALGNASGMSRPSSSQTTYPGMSGWQSGLGLGMQGLGAAGGLSGLGSFLSDIGLLGVAAPLAF